MARVAETFLSLVCYTCRKPCADGELGSFVPCSTCFEPLYCSEACSKISNQHPRSCVPRSSADTAQINTVHAMTLLTQMLGLWPCVDLVLAMDSWARCNDAIIALHVASDEDCSAHYVGTTAFSWLHAHRNDGGERLMLRLVRFAEIQEPDELRAFSARSRIIPGSKRCIMFLVCESPHFIQGTVSVTPLMLTEENVREIPLDTERQKKLIADMTRTVADDVKQLTSVIFTMCPLDREDDQTYFTYTVPYPACFKCSTKLDAPQRCGGCRRAWYCNQTCQRADRSNHKMLCATAEQK